MSSGQPSGHSLTYQLHSLQCASSNQLSEGQTASQRYHLLTAETASAVNSASMIEFAIYSLYLQAKRRDNELQHRSGLPDPDHVRFASRFSVDLHLYNHHRELAPSRLPCCYQCCLFPSINPQQSRFSLASA